MVYDINKNPADKYENHLIRISWIHQRYRSIDSVTKEAVLRSINDKDAKAILFVRLRKEYSSLLKNFDTRKIIFKNHDN